jgi:hypothetical protein
MVDQPTVPVSPAPALPANLPEKASFDERWAAWQAKGVAHDRTVRQRMAVTAPILIAVAGGVIYVLLGR